MYYGELYYLASFLIIPLGILGLIIWGLFHFVRGRRGQIDSHMKIAFSREDAVGQILIFLSVSFFVLAVQALNRATGDFISLLTISLISALSGLFLAYWQRVILLLPFSVIGLSSWILLKAVELGEPKNIKAGTYFSIALLLCLIVYALSFLHKKKFGFNRAYIVYTVLGLVGGTLALFTLSTQSGLYMFQEMTEGLAPYGSWEIMLMLVALVGGLAGVLAYSVTSGFISLNRSLFMAFLGFVSLLFLVLPQQSLIALSANYYDYSRSLFDSLTPTGVFWFFFFNILLFVELVALILSSYAERETWRVNLGTFLLFMFIAVKYFDFYSLLDKSVFFIGAGIILCSMGYFMEKGRRYMISTIKAELAVPPPPSL